MIPDKKEFYRNLYFWSIFTVLLLTAIFIWLFNTNLTLGFTDNAYHLGVAEGFARAGGIVTKDFWNSLPLGRPQNYPPLFHLIFADLIKLGFSSAIALKIMMELFVVGGLALFALGISRLYNLRVAFWSVLILTLSIRFICASVTIMPSAMVLFLSPLLFHFLKEKKWISYITLLALMLYLHLFLPLIILFALAVFTFIYERKMFFAGLRASLIALILYSPWLIHIFLNGINNIKYFDSSYEITRYQTALQINVIFVFLAIIALLFLRIKKKFIKEDFFFLILLSLFIAMAFFATERTVSGHLWIFIALFTALFLDRFMAKLTVLPYITLLLFVFTIFIMPYLVFDYGTYLDFYQPTVSKIVASESYSETSKEDRFKKLFLEIKNNSKEGEAIGTALNYFDGYVLDQGEYQSSISMFLASNTNRSTINLYQPEYFYRPLPQLSNARIVLLNKKAENLTPQYFNNFGYNSLTSLEMTKSIKNDFVQISSYESVPYLLRENIEIESDMTKNVYLYKSNKESVITETIPKFVIPFWLANSILGLLIGTLLLNNKRFR